jgi:hypothetical protein
MEETMAIIYKGRVATPAVMATKIEPEVKAAPVVESAKDDSGNLLPMIKDRRFGHTKVKDSRYPFDGPEYWPVPDPPDKEAA